MEQSKPAKEQSDDGELAASLDVALSLLALSKDQIWL